MQHAVFTRVLISLPTAGIWRFPERPTPFGFTTSVEARSAEPISCPRLPRHVAFSPDVRYLAVEQYPQRNEPGKVLIVDRRTGKIIHSLHHPQAVGQPAWSSDGALLAVPCFDKNVYVWDWAAGQPQQVCRGHRGQRLSHVNDADQGICWCHPAVK